jgi:integrase
MAKGEIRNKTEMPHNITINGDALRIEIDRAGYDIRKTISGTRWTNKRDIAKVKKIRDEWLYLISQGKPIKLEKSDHVAVPSKYLTFREAAEKYLLIGTEHCAPATIKDFKKHLNAYWLPAFGNYDLEEITTELIQEYFAEKKLQGNNYSSKTKTNYLQILNNVFAHYRLRSPGFGVVSAKGKKARQKKPIGRYKPDQIKELIAACDRNGRSGFNIRLYFTIFIGCGLRPQELLVLKWNDYDGEYLHIRRALSDYKIAPPKTGTRRKVFVPAWVRSELREAPSRFAKNWIFPNTQGKFSVKPEIYNEEWAKVHDEIGLAYGDIYDEDTGELLMVRVPYTCRHTKAAELLSMGVPHAKAAQQMGHSVKMFLEIYSEFIEEFSEVDNSILESKIKIK